MSSPERTPSSSYVYPSRSQDFPSSPVESLPDSASSDDIESEDFEVSNAEKEWKESLQQLELLLTMVLVPYIGKYFGRKCAYWGWGKYMEWKYPVQVKITSKAQFNAAGAVEAAATL
ncbi:hypothetical protein MMC25_001367 [Agyrium rufum]|nr:hypothetical protein [Agyrium rufum]